MSNCTYTETRARGADKKSAVVHMRMHPDVKALLLAVAENEGVPLTRWLIKAVTWQLKRDGVQVPKHLADKM